MKKKVLTSLSLTILVCFISAMVYAQGVLKSGQRSPEQVVSARKFAMGALAANAGDIDAKIRAGNIKGVATHATSIASLATFLPLVYEKTYPEVYPVKGSKYFFKGAVSGQIDTAAENLRVQAEKLMKLAAANDKSAVEAQVGNLFSACGGCHKPLRGKY